MTEVEYRLDGFFKICVIGDWGVGKTSLIKRYLNGTFSETRPTVGVESSFTKELDIKGHHVKVKLDDTAGQERFKTITQSYYRGAHGVAIVYDPTDTESYNNLAHWVDEVKRYANDNIDRMIIESKSDLKSSFVIDTAAAQEFAEKEGITLFMETSSKTGEGVEECLNQLIHQIFNRLNSRKSVDDDRTKTVKLESTFSSEQRKKKQCNI